MDVSKMKRQYMPKWMRKRKRKLAARRRHKSRLSRKPGRD